MSDIVQSKIKYYNSFHCNFAKLKQNENLQFTTILQIYTQWTYNVSCTEQNSSRILLSEQNFEQNTLFIFYEKNHIQA